LNLRVLNDTFAQKHNCQMPPLPKYLQDQANRLRVIRQQQQQPSYAHVVKQAEKVARRQENASRSE
jgi:hypothetical protein